MVGIDIPMQNPGYVACELKGQSVRLEAFSASTGEIWFVFRDSHLRTTEATLSTK